MPHLLVTPDTVAARRGRHLFAAAVSFSARALAHTAAFPVAVGLLAWLLLGYHPYAEDGGIYAAALAARLDPALFAHDRMPGTDWVVGQMRWTLFVPVVAGLLRRLHLSLPVGLLLLQIASVCGTVGALLRLAHVCFRTRSVARRATLLVAVAAGLPIAGTSLYLLDPYVTARSLTTPLLLLAVSEGLRRRWLFAFLLWLAAASMHPMMAGWAALPLVVLWCWSEWPARRRLPLAVAAGLLMVLGIVTATSPSADSLSRLLAQSRGYWFLSQWRWYELAGATVPLVLLAAGVRWPGLTRCWTEGGRRLAGTVCVSAATGLMATLLFAHVAGRTMAVARLQPLRSLHLFYAVFLLLFAGALIDWLQQRRQHLLLGATTVVVAAALAFTQRTLYPASAYLELPCQTPANRWQQAFVWCRDHTATDALFAIDADYTAAPGEDAQGFRATSLRSVLPDRAKDAGIAAVVPTLGAAWKLGTQAQTGLNTATDEERRARLIPLGVEWIVLSATATTGLPCPYRNATAMVCRLITDPAMARAADGSR